MDKEIQSALNVGVEVFSVQGPTNSSWTNYWQEANQPIQLGHCWFSRQKSILEELVRC